MWDYLPAEIIAELFKYMTRRDRLSCSMVCQRWQDALYNQSLWKNMVVYLDTDLLEPSTLLLTRQFYKYIKSLELGWTNPQQPLRWMPQRHQELTKRACRYIMVLDECYVQLESITLVDWCEIYRFKKIVYHLSKFLKSQSRLITINFVNVNMNKMDCMKLLASCLGSEDSIQQFRIRNCYHQYQSIFGSSHFISCLERLSHLCVLKIDYSSLIRGVIDALLTCPNRNLELLHVSVRDTDYMSDSAWIGEENWASLSQHCPRLKVGLNIRSLCHFDHIRYLLRETIPLSSFTMLSGRIWDQSRSRNYRKTISLLIKNYRKTLESINLQIKNNQEVLDDMLLSLIRKCPLLENFDFQGVVENAHLLKDIWDLQMGTQQNRFKYFHVFPKLVTLEYHVTFTEIFVNVYEKIKKDMEFKVFMNDIRDIVHVYY